MRLGLRLGLLRPAALDQLEVALRRQRGALLLDDGLGELRHRVALPGHLGSEHLARDRSRVRANPNPNPNPCGREHLPRDDPEGVDLARLVRARIGVG